MAFGFISISAALYYMATRFNLTMDFRTAFMMRTYQMVGLAFIFVPQNVLAYVGIPREKNNQISSMNSFVRNIGGSIGIALITTSISRIAQQRPEFAQQKYDARKPCVREPVRRFNSSIEEPGRQQQFGYPAGSRSRFRHD